MPKPIPLSAATPARPACAGLWDTPMVQVNGDVTVCCLDERLLNKVGNVNETPLRDIWRGATLDAWRKAQVEGRFSDSGPYCTSCNWRSAGTMSAERVAAWRAGRR